MKKEDLLDLNEAVQNPGKKLSFTFSTALNQEEDLDLVEPVTGQIDAVSTGNMLLVDTGLETTAVVECARCGARLEVKVNFKMKDEFEVEGVPSCYASDGYAKVVTDEPEQLFKNNALFRDRYVRQGLLLNIPVQPLCSFGWDGPCPNADKDDGEEEPHGHPAFADLGNLMGGDST